MARRAALATTLVLAVMVALPGGARADDPKPTVVETPAAQPVRPARPVPPPVGAAGKKWGPHVDTSFKTDDDRHLGMGDIFLPVWQDGDSLAFLDLRVTGDNDDNLEGNIGAAYRTFVGDSWILGGYGFFDVRSSDEYGSRNTFLGGALGVEALSEQWDLRANGYIPEDDTKSAPGATTGAFSGGTVIVKTGEERALWGFDGEVGARLPFFGEDSPFWDTRLYAGGYYFDADEVSGFGGPRGRFESRIYEIPFLDDMLGYGTRLTFSAEVSWDDQRNVTSYGGVSLRIPLYGWFGGGQGSGSGGRLTKLERRMTDPIVRDVDINTIAADTGSEPALNPKNQQPIGDAVFASGGGSAAGDGSQQDPYDLATATGTAGFNGVVGVLGNDGPLQEGNVALSEGQIVAGSGSSFWVIGEHSHQRVQVTVPGSERPLVDNPNAGAGDFAFFMAPYSLITGLDITHGWGGISVDNHDGAMVADVDFDATGRIGIEVLDSQHFSAQDLRFRNFDNSTALGIYASSAPCLRLSGLWFEDFGDVLTSEAYALRLLDSSDSKISNVVIRGLYGADVALGIDVQDSYRVRLKGFDADDIYSGNIAYGLRWSDSGKGKVSDFTLNGLYGGNTAYGAYISGAYRFKGFQWRITEVGGGNSVTGLEVEDSNDTKFKNGLYISGIDGLNATGLRYQSSSNARLEYVGIDGVFGGASANGAAFGNSPGLYAVDWSISGIQGSSARGAEIESDEAFFRRVRIANVFGGSSADGISFQNSSNVIGKKIGVENIYSSGDSAGIRASDSSFSLGYDWAIDGVRGNFSVGYEFSFLDDSLFLGLESKQIQGDSFASGFRLYESSNITVKNLDVDGVDGGNEALGTGVSFSDEITGWNWSVSNVMAADNAFGVNYDWVTNSRFKRTSVTGIRGENVWGANFDFGSFLDVTELDVRNVEASGAGFGINLGSVDNYWGVKLNVNGVQGGNEATGVVAQETSNTYMDDVEVRNIDAQNFALGLRVGFVNNWHGQNWLIDGVTGDDARGADFDGTDFSSWNDWAIHDVKARLGYSVGWRVDSSFHFNASNWQVENVEGGDGADGWEVGTGQFYFAEDWKIGGVYSSGLSRGAFVSNANDVDLRDGSVQNVQGSDRAIGFKGLDSMNFMVNGLMVSGVDGDRATGFRLNNTDDATLIEVYLSNIMGQTGAWGFEIDSSDDLTASNGSISGITGDGAWGIDIGASLDALIQDYQISGINGQNDPYGIRVSDGSDGASFLRVDVSGVADNGSGTGFGSYDSGVNGNPVTFDDGSISGVAGWAVRVQNSWLDGNGNDASGNDVDDCEDLGGNNGQLLFAQFTCNF